MKEPGMVIIGAGEAGTRAAMELRIQGWTGAITLIGEEKQVPYERPPLSKECLTIKGEPLAINIISQEELLKHDINFLSGRMVEEIDRNNKLVKLADGQWIGYERLLLATGARPRKLSVEGIEHSNVLYLRTFADALKLRSHLQPHKKIVVIGGGFIGLEVAASATKNGCSVTLIEVGPRILMRGVPEEIAQIVEARHCKAGVVFKFGVGIRKIETSDVGLSVVLADGSFVDCDMVLVGIGAIPETTLAAQCRLEIDNGISVSEMLVTSDPHIFAAGDCCSFPHRLYEGKKIRLEAWRNAKDQGIHVAKSMLGSFDPYVAIPWFWSDQYEHNLQVTGVVDCGEITVIRDMGEKGKLFFHLSNDRRLVAASGIGAPSIAKDIRIAEMLIERQVKLNPSNLEDPKMKLKGMLRLQNV
jgi:3-phenylpropionate/trans-cinnamate dioxygenase ferredoxin reductase subunit